MDRAQYTIFPESARPPSIEEAASRERPLPLAALALEALLVGLFATFCVLAVVVNSGLWAIPPDDQFRVWLRASACVFLLYFIGRSQLAIRRRSHRVNQELAALTDQHIKRITDTAADKTRKASEWLSSAGATASAVVDAVRNVEGLMATARAEYDAHAFGPFWDAVEGAAHKLAEADLGLKFIAESATSYYATLSACRHTFPVFEPQPQDLPDLRPVLNEFQKVVRLGQTNYEFANIWEHRRTRAVLIAGFTTLGDAISSLANTIEVSISDLQAAMSSELAHVVEEQVALREQLVTEHETLQVTLESQTAMLDNIQRRRKPAGVG